jgi:hypothetical protein
VNELVKVKTGVVVVVVEVVVCRITVDVAGAEGDVMKQLQAELIRLAGTVAKYVGRGTLLRFFTGAAAGVQAAGSWSGQSRS